MPARLTPRNLVRQKLTAFLLAGGIADLGRTAAGERDRPMAGPLKKAKQHDADQIADMQAVSGGIEADIGGQPFRGRELVKGVEVGRLVQETAFERRPE